MYSIKTDLGVSGNSTIDKDLLVKGNAVINGNFKVDGTVDFANATFTQITVTGTANLADINSTGTASLANVAVSGNTVLGDASTATVTVNATSTFAAPATFNGDVSQTAGTASFKATSVDSLSVAGVSQLNGNLNMGSGTKATTNDLETETLKVNGTSILGGTLNVTGKTTLGDVEINGALSGSYTMDAGNFNTINVSQLSSLNNVNITGSTTLTGNVTGANSSVSVKRLNMQGSDAIVEFAYNDPARPSDTKTSIEPYQVSTQAVVSKKLTSNSADIGVIGGTEGLHAIGKATIDYLNITGNSTIGDQNQLQVAGKSVFTGKTTVGDLEITGSVSGLTFSDLSANTLTVTGQSTLQGVTLGGNITGANASIAKFSTFSVADGTAGNHGIIQFDYNDSARPSDIKSSIEPYKVSTNDVAANNVVTANATVGNVGGTAGLTALGKSTMDYLKIAGNSTIGTASPQLEVTGKSVLGDVDFTGVVTGLTVDVSGQDLTPNSVVATAQVNAATFESTDTVVVGTDLTVGGFAHVTEDVNVGTTLTVGGASTFEGNVTVDGQTTTIKDLVVTGTTTGVTAVANVDGLDIKPNSVESTTSVKAATFESTGNIKVGGNITTDGTAIQLAKDTSVTGTLRVSSNVIATGNLNASGAQLTGTGTALGVSANATIGGTLTVDGNTSFGGSTGTTTIHDLVVTGTTTGVTVAANVDGLDIKPNSVEVDTTLEVTGATTLSDLSAGATTVSSLTTTGSANLASATVTGNVSAATVTAPTVQAEAAGAGTLTLVSNVVAAKDLTVTGNLIPQGGLDLSAVDIASKSIATTEGATIGGNLSVSGSVDLSGADVTALSFTSSDEDKTNTFPKLVSTTSNIGTLTATGLTATTANVTGATTLAGVTAGSVGVTSLTASGAVSAASFTSAASTVEIAKSTNVTGDFHASGTLTAGAIDLSTTDVTVKSLESLGNTHIVGDLTVDGQFDLSATNLQAASLTSTNDTTVGGALVLTSGTVTGSPKISGTLNVTGATTLAATSASTLSTSGLATLASLDVTGNTVANGNLTVEGTLLPQGGLDLTGADIEANSIALAASATVGTTLGVTGATTLSNTLGVTGLVTASNGLTVSAGNLAVSSGTVTASGAGRFGSVTADNGSTVTAGDLVVTAGNINQNGAATATASFKKTTTTNLHVGSLVWDETKYIAEVGGAMHVSGDLDVDGTINAQINLSGRDIAPRSVTTSQNLNVGTTLEVGGQATIDSAIIGAPSSVNNNNLQVNGNTVCTGDFTVQGLIIGTLDQTTSDVTFKSVTTTSGASIGTNATVGGTLGVTGTTTLAGLNAENTAITGTLSSSGLATLNSASVTTTLGVTGNTTLGGTLGVTGNTTLADTIISSLSVTGTSGFTGLVTTANLTSTGLITANDLTVTGTFSADIASLTTTSISTQKYEVIPATSASVASGATWTSDGSSNVYNLTLTGAAGAVNIDPLPIVVGKAASWFIYITQDSTGGKTVNWDTSMSQIGDSIVNTAPNSVSICQVVYCGVGSIVDVFIAQRSL